MSGCGNSSCSCASCSCNGCSCKRSMDTFPALAAGMEGSEGCTCKCGDNCSCNPCTCK